MTSDLFSECSLHSVRCHVNNVKCHKTLEGLVVEMQISVILSIVLFCRNTT